MEVDAVFDVGGISAVEVKEDSSSIHYSLIIVIGFVVVIHSIARQPVLTAFSRTTTSI